MRLKLTTGQARGIVLLRTSFPTLCQLSSPVCSSGASTATRAFTAVQIRRSTQGIVQCSALGTPGRPLSSWRARCFHTGNVRGIAPSRALKADISGPATVDGTATSNGSESASVNGTREADEDQPLSMTTGEGALEKKKKKGRKTKAGEWKQVRDKKILSKADLIVLTPPIATLPAGELSNLGMIGEWPAQTKALHEAQNFLREAAQSPDPVLLVPDRDVDGICAGSIIKLTLQLMGKPLSKIKVHFTRNKARSVFSKQEKADIETLCQSQGITHIILLDQCKRESVEEDKEKVFFPAQSVPGSERKTLIIDHNKALSFPPYSTVLTSQFHKPIAPASLLAYALCTSLHPTAPAATALHAIVGTLTELSHMRESPLQLLRSPPCSIYLNTEAILKKYTIKWTEKLIALLKISRRAPIPDMSDALMDSLRILQFDPHSDPTEWPSPKKILSGDWGTPEYQKAVARLNTLHNREQEELQKWKRTAPRFTSDGRLALLEISSKWQIHPNISRIWARMLQQDDPKLLGVMCANLEFSSEKVYCSVQRTTLGRESEQDLNALLSEYADKVPGKISSEIAHFVGGSKESTYGTIDKGDWESYVKEGFQLLPAGQGGVWRQRTATKTATGATTTTGSWKDRKRTLKEFGWQALQDMGIDVAEKEEIEKAVRK